MAAALAADGLQLDFHRDRSLPDVYRLGNNKRSRDLEPRSLRRLFSCLLVLPLVKPFDQLDNALNLLSTVIYSLQWVGDGRIVVALFTRPLNTSLLTEQDRRTTLWEVSPARLDES